MTNQRRTPSKNSQKTTKTCELKQKPLYSDKLNNNKYDKLKTVIKAQNTSKKTDTYFDDSISIFAPRNQSSSRFA